VPPNLRFIPHPPQRNARKLPSQGVGDAPAQRGFAHAGRADQAQDRAFDLLAPFDDRQELQQPVFDLAQPVVLFVEDSLGFRQVNFVLGFPFPRQA